MSARRTPAVGARCSGRPSCRCTPCDRRLRHRADAATDAVPIVITLIQAIFRA